MSRYCFEAVWRTPKTNYLTLLSVPILSHLDTQGYPLITHSLFLWGGLGLRFEFDFLQKWWMFGTIAFTVEHPWRNILGVVVLFNVYFMLWKDCSTCFNTSFAFMILEDWLPFWQSDIFISCMHMYYHWWQSSYWCLNFSKSFSGNISVLKYLQTKDHPERKV